MKGEKYFKTKYIKQYIMKQRSLPALLALIICVSAFPVYGTN